MATLTTNIPVSTDLYTIDATSYDTFALTFVDGQVNRAQFPNVSVTFDFAAISLPADLSQWVTVTITQPATGRVSVKWAGNVRVDPGVSISTAASTATTVYAFTSTGRDWTVFPSSISGVASDLSSQFGPLLATGNRTVFLGDSITRGGQDTSEAALDDDRFRSASIPTWASILSRQRILEVAMAGVGGDTVADMLARFDTDVTPFAPNVVVILAGTNDTNSLHLTSITDYAATMAALVAKVRSIAARPVLCTIPPHRGDVAVADRKTRIATINHWLRRWAPANGITLIDLNALWSDRATDDYATDYIRSGDDTHPSELAYYDAGQKIATVLAAELPANALPLSASNVDPLNKIANGQFLGSLTSGIPTSWTGPVQSGVTGSQITNDTTINGYWYKATSAGHASTNTLSQTVSGIVGGHTYAFSGLLKADFATGNLLLRLRFNSSSTSGYEWRPVSLLTRDIADGAFYLECLAPSDATTAFIEIRYAADTAGYVQVANLTLIDLDGIPT